MIGEIFLKVNIKPKYTEEFNKEYLHSRLKSNIVYLSPVQYVIINNVRSI